MFRAAVAAASMIAMTMSGASQPVEYRVGQKDRTFSAAILKIHAGDRIVFNNDDQITHNVFSTAKGHEFNLRAQAPGTSASTTFATTGIVEIRCAFHPKMKLVVTVER